MNAHAMQENFRIVAGPVSEWGVLTCANAVTLRLASTLDEAGYQAWAPKIDSPKRRGRKRDRETVPEAVMPGFVFVPWQHVWQLAQMAYSPSQQFQTWDEEKGRMVAKTCPYFTVLRHEHDRKPARIANRGLDSLRMHEQAGQPVELIRVFERYEQVRYPAAGFEGLTGVVISSKPKETRVAFPGDLVVTIPTALLIVQTAGS